MISLSYHDIVGIVGISVGIQAFCLLGGIAIIGRRRERRLTDSLTKKVSEPMIFGKYFLAQNDGSDSWPWEIHSSEMVGRPSSDSECFTCETKSDAANLIAHLDALEDAKAGAE